MLKILALSALIAASAVTVASANVVYNLQNVGFADGGIATGTLTVDPSGSLSNYDVSVSGGDTGSFPAFTYSTSTSSEMTYEDYRTTNWIYELNQKGSSRGLRIAVASQLSPNGGVYALASTEPLAAECYNCSPFRTFSTSGELTSTPTAVPEPASLAVLGTGLVGLGLLRRRKRG